jgi:bacterioferritin
LAYLGGVPTTKPDPIFMGKNLKEMLKADKKAEEEAISMYKEIIKIAREEDDETTQKLFQGILADEEEHHDTFTSLLSRS